MNRLTSYKTKLTVVLKHEYYTRGCPVELCPDAATLRIFNRYGILFHPQGANKWQLLVRDDFRTEDLADEETRFHFNLLVRDELVYYVSREMEPNIVIDMRTSGEQFDLHIPASEKQFEYICIPKYTSVDVPVKMKEEKDRIRLKAEERVSLPDIPVALRFVSEEKIKLKQQSNLKIQLWEIRENGERLASREIPNPRPDRYSPISPRDTITSFFYY